MIQYGRHEDALIAKLKLLEFSESHMGLRYLRGFEESMNAQHPVEHQMPDGFLSALQITTLREAEPAYVSMEITEIVDQARESMAPEVLLPSDPFTPKGFALLPRPILLDDAPVTEANPWRSPNSILPVRAIAWYPIHTEDMQAGCFWIHFYTHTDDDLAAGRPVEEAQRIRGSLGPLSLMHTWQWTWGTDSDRIEPYAIQGEDIEQSRLRAHQQVGLVQAFWRISQQFVASKHRAPRPLRREAKRKDATGEDITVIHLRRSKPGDDEFVGEGGKLTHQHLVRGYWGRRHTRDGVRQVWVRPYVRGPEGTELVLTERRWQVDR